MEVYVKGGEGKIPEIVKVAEEIGVDIESINLRKTSLEDIYLHYTGRMIREEEADTGERMRIMARRWFRR